MRKRFQQVFALTAILLVATMLTAAASSTGLTVGSSEKVPNPTLAGTVEKAQHQMGKSTLTATPIDDGCRDRNPGRCPPAGFQGLEPLRCWSIAWL